MAHSVEPSRRLRDAYEGRTPCEKARRNVESMRILVIAASCFALAVLVIPHP
jgi:hypothetical protein